MTIFFEKTVEEFIAAVSWACLSNDRNYVHVLAQVCGEKVYAAIPIIAANKEYKKVDNLVICRVDGEMIGDLFFEAGTDEWSMEWLEYVIRQKVDGKPYLKKVSYKRKIRKSKRV